MTERVAPFFAVIIPVHNKAPHLCRSISSVLAQTFRDFELLIVDDASTDGSLKVIQQFDDPRIRVFHRSEAGPGGYAARNLGIAHATARWMTFLDADDEWDKNFLLEIHSLTHAAPENIGCAFTGYVKHRPDGYRLADIWSSRLPTPHAAYDFESFLRVWISQRNCPPCTISIAVRKDIMDAVGGFPDGRCRRGGDKDTWLRILSATNAVASRRQLAIYFQDSVNMVTRRESTRETPCLVPTAHRLLNSVQRNSREKRFLRKLINLETFMYLKNSAKEGKLTPADVLKARSMTHPISLIGASTLISYLTIMKIRRLHYRSTRR